jgi:predicted lipid-binding transport protein (Tim44 family)
MPADVILLAAVAAFVLLRLRGVLGQRIGHDQPPPAPLAGMGAREGERVIVMKPVTVKEAAPAAESEEEPAYAEPIERGIAELRAHDRLFQMKEFLGGASIAFDMVHDAFRKGEKDTLKSLLSKAIYQEFLREIEHREKEERHTESTLVSILSAEPVSVETEGQRGRISVAFVSTQVILERTRAGAVVEGSSTEEQRVEDEWTFERDLHSSNPNWTIIAT